MSVRIGNRAGLSNVIQSAQLAGFHGNISRTPALYLGTWEASPLDIASAYSVFANGGVRPTPYIIDHITDSQGQPRFAITKSKRTVYSQRAANITSSILQQVCKPGGTAGRITALGFKSPCGGKTGTTNNYTNAWFAGYTSNLTCSVWVGFDSSTKILEKGYGGTLALPGLGGHHAGRPEGGLPRQRHPHAARFGRTGRARLPGVQPTGPFRLPVCQDGVF